MGVLNKEDLLDSFPGLSSQLHGKMALNLNFTFSELRWFSLFGLKQHKNVRTQVFLVCIRLGKKASICGFNNCMIIQILEYSCQSSEFSCNVYPSDVCNIYVGKSSRTTLCIVEIQCKRGNTLGKCFSYSH